MIHELHDWLAEITGFARVWLQPNAGSQGEYAGLRYIRTSADTNFTARPPEEKVDLVDALRSAAG